MAIDWCRETWSCPESEQWRDWRTRHQIERWLQGSLQRCLPFWFVSFRSSFISFCSILMFVVCFLQGHRQFTNTLFFWSSKRNFYHGNVCKTKGQNASVEKNNKTLYRMKTIVLLSELWDRTVLSCYIWSMTSLFYVNVDFMDYLKPVCFMLIIFFSFVKEDIIAHYLAHTRKSGSCLRKARVPEYQLHAILMYVFMRKEEEKKRCGGKNSKHWKLWISEEEKIPFVSKSVAVTH